MRIIEYYLEKKVEKMKNRNAKLQTPSLFFILFSFFFLLASYLVDAQTAPRFLTSWKAQSYVPGWYQGKIFPAPGTPVEVGFELIDNGRIADLSETKVRWYLNDNLVRNEENGLGIKSLNFIAPQFGGRNVEVRIAVLNYGDGGGQIDEIIHIPVAKPEAVIDAPYPDRLIGVGKSSFRAAPFFFGTKDVSADNFSFEWSIDGKKVEGFFENQADFVLDVGSQAPAGAKLRLSVLAKNLLKELEFASGDIQLEVR